MNFSYICKYLSGSRPAQGDMSGMPACAKRHETGDFCTPDSGERATAAKGICPDADFLMIPSAKKKKF